MQLRGMMICVIKNILHKKCRACSESKKIPVYLYRNWKIVVSMNLQQFFLLLVLFTITACQKEGSDWTEVIEEETEPTAYYRDSYMTGILNSEGQGAVSAAIVTMENNLAVSSERGVFIFHRARINASGSWMVVHAPGYFDFYGFVRIREKAISTPAITMVALKPEYLTVFSNSQGIEIQKEQITLTVPEAAFVYSTGNAYNGAVNFYFKEVVQMLGKPRARNLKGSYGVLSNEKYYEMMATTNAGEKLILNRPIICRAADTGQQIFQIDVKKAVMQELKSEGNQVSFSELTLLAIGNWSKSIGLSLKLTAENELPIAGATAMLYGPGATITELLTDQQGFVDFNYQQGESCKVVVKDGCGNLLFNAVTPKPWNEEILQASVPLTQLKKLVSTVNTCNGMLTADDRVYSLMENGKGAALIAQGMGKLSVMIPWCSIPENVGLYRGREQLYSIQLADNVAVLDSIELRSPDKCVEKVSAYFNIDNNPVLLNQEEYYIFYENSGNKELVVSDLSSFTISIPISGSSGKIVPSAVMFTHPTITDCNGPECNQLEVTVKKIGEVGEEVEIEIAGSIQGKKINGEFINVLIK